MTSAAESKTSKVGKAKSCGIAKLRERVQAVQNKARPPLASAAKPLRQDSPLVTGKPTSLSTRARAKKSPVRTTSNRKQQTVNQVAPLPRSPRPARKTSRQPSSAVKPQRTESNLKIEVPPRAPTPSDDGSELSYVTVDSKGEPTRPLPILEGTLREIDNSPLAPEREKSPLIPDSRAASPWPAAQPRSDTVDANVYQFEELVDGFGSEDAKEELDREFAAVQEEEEEAEEVQADDDFLPPPPAQQSRRRPYEPKRPREEPANRQNSHFSSTSQVDYDVEMEPQDLLASFLSADRAVKSARPRRKDFDEDEEVEVIAGPSGETLGSASVQEVEEEQGANFDEEEDGSDEDLPDFDEVLVKAKEKGKAASKPKERGASFRSEKLSSSSAPSKVKGKGRGTPSRTKASQPDSDGTDYSVDSPPTSKLKNISHEGNGKGKAKSTAKGKSKPRDSGPVDTEALLDLLPKRKRRVELVVELDSDDEEGETTDYDEDANTTNRKGAKAGRKKTPSASKSKAKSKKPPTRSKKSAGKRVEKEDQADELDSEAERGRQKRLKEYHELANFKLGTEIVA
ncbi:hypothetical protein P7C70_g3163, partial [Phenoliferia sp. Uapishka_3]